MGQWSRLPPIKCGERVIVRVSGIDMREIKRKAAIGLTLFSKLESTEEVVAFRQLPC